MARERTSGLGRGPEVHGVLAYLTRPLYPILRKVTIRRRGPRGHEPKDILLPDGYVAEIVATGLNTPVHCTFAPDGTCYVVECGFKIEERPRILKVDVDNGDVDVFWTLPPDRWTKTGAMTGACWHDGALYVANTDSVFRIDAQGRVEDIVTGLPGRGDHQTNYPAVGPDGKLYFTVGTATNTGVVGPDNFNYEWLRHFEDVCDVPGADVTLVGTNFESQDVRAEDGNLARRVSTGAFAPFGTPTERGQVVRGHVKCNGAVLRCNPDGSDLELVAWGLRNPYGKAFAPDGRLFVTDHGIDERGHRHIFGDPDDLYEIENGRWYGWPDYAAGVRLDDPYWGRRGRGRDPVIAEPPERDPPRPVATFEPHSGANGLTFARGEFGFEGDAFVCLFGDLNPNTTRQATPAGYKIVRVETQTGQVHDFAVNRIVGPASKLPHDGFERPSHCEFGPDGALYVVDWGEIEIALEAGGVRMQAGTGTLWRIRRVPGARVAVSPPEPRRVPLYAFLFYIPALLILVAAAIGIWALIRWLA